MRIEDIRSIALLANPQLPLKSERYTDRQGQSTEGDGKGNGKGRGIPSRLPLTEGTKR